MEETMTIFEGIQEAPTDPILGLVQAFRNEQRPFKINLGVGAYRTDEGKPWVLPEVRKAEALLLERGECKEYLPIDGDPHFCSLMRNLVFESLDERIYAAQTTGGTGALRVAGEFLVHSGIKKIYLSKLTWPNHPRIFKACGMEIHDYPYCKDCQLDFEGMTEAMLKMDKGSAILLQAVCHNPTGFDLDEDQWEKVIEILKARQLVPLFDLAYQGFGDGLREDGRPLRLFANAGIDGLVAASCAKNFGLYSERVGTLFAICQDELIAKRVQSQIRVRIRGLYSNPPRHGAAIVRTILAETPLRDGWKQNLESMRMRIKAMREGLIDRLEEKMGNGCFSWMRKQKGMFSYTGLSPAQAEQLTKEFAIYLPKSGRINVAGLNSKNLDQVAEAILSVL